MLAYLVKRVLWIFPTLLGITFITFMIMKLAPGDPVSLKLMFAGDTINPQALAAELAKEKSPIDLPEWYKQRVAKVSQIIHGQPIDGQPIHGHASDTLTAKSLTWIGENSLYYGKWLGNLVALDFGLSSKDRRPVMTRIKEALPITLTLNIISILLVYLISIPLGIWSAIKQNSLIDKIVMIKLFILYSLPTFWVGTLLLAFFSGGDYLNWFPMGGYVSDGADQLGWLAWAGDVLWHLCLPIAVSVYGSFAFLSRFSRTNFLEVVRQDYIRTATAKGLSKSVVLWKHAFRNSMIPLITMMGTLLPALLGGSVIIEQIFNIPGMGLLSFEAVMGRDTNMIMGIAAIDAGLTLISLLITDLLYVVVDPRISFEGR